MSSTSTSAAATAAVPPPIDTPRGESDRSSSGLSSSLIRDYHAIISSLEQGRSLAPATVAPPAPVAADAGPADPRPAAGAEPVIRTRPSLRRPVEGEAAPKGFAELRSRLSALSESRDIVTPRRTEEPQPAPAEPAAARPARPSLKSVLSKSAPANDPLPSPVLNLAPVAADAATGRRAFGCATRGAGEAATGRRRAAAKAKGKDAFTWQRLGVLTLCMAALGGAGVALQSVVGRDEARVAPEVIGNAAIASVAPSSAAPASAAPVVIAAAPVSTLSSVQPAVAETAPTPASAPADAAPALLATAAPDASVPGVAHPADAHAADAPVPATAAEAVAAVVPTAIAAPKLATAAPPVAGVTAFAATDADPLAAAAEAKPVRAAALPSSAPLPPPAPTKHAAAPVAAIAAAPVQVAAAASPDKSEADAADASSVAGSGGDPVGGAVLRSSVTMRAAPKNGAAAVLNLKGGQRVELVACDQWCEILVDGKRGFVYKRFIDSAGARDTAAVEPSAATDGATQ